MKNVKFVNGSRLYIGVTGQIGTGKSLVSNMLARSSGDCQIFDADHQVHTLYESDADFMREIKNIYDECIIDNQVSRSILYDFMISDPQNWDDITSLVHNKIYALAQDYHSRYDRVVYDVPLLHKSNISSLCDIVICTVCSQATQEVRVMSRPGMNADKLQHILSLQKQLGEADYIVDTDLDIEDLSKEIDKILEKFI